MTLINSNKSINQIQISNKWVIIKPRKASKLSANNCQPWKIKGDVGTEIALKRDDRMHSGWWQEVPRRGLQRDRGLYSCWLGGKQRKRKARWGKKKARRYREERKSRWLCKRSKINLWWKETNRWNVRSSPFHWIIKLRNVILGEMSKQISGKKSIKSMIKFKI